MLLVTSQTYSDSCEAGDVRLEGGVDSSKNFSSYIQEEEVVF